MSQQSDEHEVPVAGDGPQSNAPSLTANWQNLLTYCASLGPEDDAWDSADDFVSALGALVHERRAERDRIRAERDRIRAEREAVVADARARLDAVAGIVRTAPGCEQIAGAIDRVLAGEISPEQAGSLAETAEAFGASATAVGALRAEIVERARVWASPDEMEALVNDLRLREADRASRAAALVALLEGGPAEAQASDAALAAGLDEDSVNDSVEAGVDNATHERPEVARRTGRGRLLSREEAETLYADPAAALEAPGPLPPDEAELAALWASRNHKNPSRRDRLRRLFAEVVAGVGASPNGADATGAVESKVVRIDLAEARARLDADGIDVSALTPLDGFDALAVASAPTSEGLGATAFAQNLIAFVASEDEDRAVRVFLAPNLPRPSRDEAIRKLRTGGLPAAILDDLDACRLLAPGGDRPHGLLALVAIVAEQLGGS